MNTNTFRTLAIGVSILSALAFVPAHIAFAQGPGSPLAGLPDFRLDFDEQGNSLLNGGPNPNLVQATGLGLVFWLPVMVNPGDVVVQALHDIDPTKNPNGITDLLSFSNQQNTTGTLTGVMLFQSLIDDNDTRVDAADVTTFINYIAAIPPINEIGVEGSNYFDWVPGLPTGTFYHGISDGTIPEPSTFVLGGLGLLSLAALAYRRSRWAKTA